MRAALFRICDICSQPAVQSARDAIEGEPERGEDGMLWATYQPGPARYGCIDHPPYPGQIIRKQELPK